MLAAACTIFSGCGWSTAGAADRAAPIELRISTDGELLAFEPEELTCPAGARVRVIFRHAGQRIPQEHNWVLLRPGTEESVMQAGVTAGLAAGFVPPADARVLAATPLCGRGAEAMVEFTAPAAGDYPFVCTFPGHGAVMHGVLHVTAK